MSLEATVIENVARLAVEAVIAIFKQALKPAERVKAFSELDKLLFRAKAQARLDARRAKK